MALLFKRGKKSLAKFSADSRGHIHGYYIPTDSYADISLKNMKKTMMVKKKKDVDLNKNPDERRSSRNILQY